jgi:hypothetical protein
MVSHAAVSVAASSNMSAEAQPSTTIAGDLP